LERRNLITFRKGEFVMDPVKGVAGPAASECIKIKENRGAEHGCMFYDGTAKACTIYDQRPLQCRALMCWDTRNILKVLASPKLKRQDLVDDNVLLGLMAEHEKRCSYKVLHDCVVSIGTKADKAVERIIDLLKFDYHLRPFVSEKLSLPLNEMDFFFGRPLMDTIRNYGLQVIREADGSFFLTKIEKNGVME